MYDMTITYDELEYIIKNKKGKIQVHTPTGLENVSSVYGKYSPGLEITYEDGTKTIGAKTHLVYYEPVHDFITLSRLNVGDSLSDKLIIEKKELPQQKWIDFTVDAEHSSYHQNGILHHNSGKSIIQFLLMLELSKITEKKILMIVPNISLVTQLFQDFKDYSENNGYDVDSNVHMIMGGREKNANKKIYLSTWQSLDAIKDKSYFEQFEAVIADECHQYKATALSKIMENCVNAFYRIGVSGTLEDTQTAETALIGHFGPIHRVSSSADLMERDILAKLEVNLLLLKYSEQAANTTKHLDYIGEMDYLVSLKERNEFITKLAYKLKGNTLVLVQYIDKHGKVLEKLCKEFSNDKQVYFVYGGTEADDRNNVRKIAEINDNVIIIASYQVFSTGVNIKNLPNIIFGSPTKSKIRLLQSIGRGLRKHDKKDICRVFDLADDLRGKRKKANYTLKHCLERLQIYTNEGFTVKETTIKFKVAGDIC